VFCCASSSCSVVSLVDLGGCLFPLVLGGMLSFVFLSLLFLASNLFFLFKDCVPVCFLSGL
jgi:hypothetical protein